MAPKPNHEAPIFTSAVSGEPDAGLTSPLLPLLDPKRTLVGEGAQD